MYLYICIVYTKEYSLQRDIPKQAALDLCIFSLEQPYVYVSCGGGALFASHIFSDLYSI